MYRAVLAIILMPDHFQFMLRTETLTRRIDFALPTHDWSDTHQPTLYSLDIPQNTTILSQYSFRIIYRKFTSRTFENIAIIIDHRTTLNIRITDIRFHIC